jgi:hypothetical protein
MRFVIAWLLFGIPLAAVVFAWIGLCTNWSAEKHRFTKVSAILLPMAAALLACCVLAYVQFVRPIAAIDYRVGAWGLLLSLLGTTLGLVALRFPRWFSSLAFGASAWMCVLFLLAASIY